MASSENTDKPGTGKSILITGGSRGIGEATAFLFAQKGYAVCVNYRRDAQAAARLVTRIEELGVRALAIQADVSVEAEVVSLFEQFDAAFGAINCLVNNAGVIAPQQKLADMQAERISRLLQNNILGYFLCCREAVRRMSTPRGQGGAIVNISSVAARTGSPNEYIDYAATKGAIDTLTRGLATEVAALGIRVNAVRPGFIHTSMHADAGEPDRIRRLSPLIPMQRGGDVTEVAQAVYWLASDAASYVSGTFIDVAGGR